MKRKENDNMKPNTKMLLRKLKEEQIKRNQEKYVQDFFNKKCGRRRGK